MILKNYKTITPTRRFLFFYKIYIQQNLSKKFIFNKLANTNTRKNFLKHFKSTHITKIKTYPHLISSFLTLKKFNSVLINFFLHPKKKKLYSKFLDIYNLQYIVPTTDKHFVGFKFFQIFKQINQPFILADVPYYYNICLISFNLYQTATLCKSSGCFATKFLYTKKNKLCLITLPSSEKKFISKFSLCILGIIFDLKTNIKWIGKFKNKTNYKLNVRGVAMNPVDHPNGGRTKAKQPEKSPWGWIAKHNK